MTPQQERLLNSVMKKFALLLQKIEESEKSVARETWVTAKYITDLTGWNNVEMFRARKEGIITFKKADSGGYRYLLESLSEKFIKSP